MIVATTRLEITTDEGVSLSDVTADVNEFVRSTGAAGGLCIVSTAAPGSCLSLSAAFDEDVDDLLRLARRHLSALRGALDEDARPPADRVDAEGGGYTPAGVLADCLSVPIRDGSLAVGSWEAIVLLDGSGPDTRTLDITVVGS